MGPVTVAKLRVVLTVALAFAFRKVAIALLGGG
jgi:hypothetical protein